jgi:hypothetical protein
MTSAERVDERFVVRLWESQAIAPSSLQRLGIRVIFRGVPSDAGGPDYQDAILSIHEREIARGDVEFHVRASDWYRHGHQHDSHYNRVILHVVWIGDSAETVRADGRRIPVLCLASPLPDEAHPDLVHGARALLRHPCVEAFGALPPDELGKRIRSVGVACFRQRVERLSAELSCVEPDQVAYAAILEGLGYASNRETFGRLADIVTYAWLQSIDPEDWVSTLLDASGLGPRAEVMPPGHLDARSWRLSRIRPNNHPTLRLTGIGIFLQRLGPNLAEKLCESVTRATRPSHLRSLFLVEKDGQGLIGPGRAGELVVSVLLPFVAASQPFSPHAEELFKAHPSPPINRWTRVMQRLLAEAGHEFKPRTAPEHQGLHFLYHSYCRPQRRGACPVCSLSRT